MIVSITTVDIFTVADLMDACGVDLDSLGDQQPRPENFRYAGFSLILYIEYRQRRSDPESEWGIEYVYTPRPITAVEYKKIVPIGHNVQQKVR